MPSYADEPVHAMLAQVDPDGELAPCGLRRLVLGSQALAAVADTVDDLLPAGRASSGRATVALLVDRTPIARGPEDLKDVLHQQLAARFEVRRTVLDDGHPELHVVDEVLDAASVAVHGVDAVVAMGGGTISDIGKMAVHRARSAGEHPVLVSVQTAASVDGYTDDVSVVLRGGVKRGGRGRRDDRRCSGRDEPGGLRRDDVDVRRTRRLAPRLPRGDRPRLPGRCGPAAGGGRVGPGGVEPGSPDR
jgi:glycerol-1-phosphate dehydrogenase [NAD(P)+]